MATATITASQGRRIPTIILSATFGLALGAGATAVTFAALDDVSRANPSTPSESVSTVPAAPKTVVGTGGSFGSADTAERWLLSENPPSDG